jgi:FkbM family methyltransferase
MPFVPEVDRVCDHSFFSAPLGPGSVVVDLGCNRGEFARAIHGRFGCRIYGAEPVPELYRALPELPGFAPLQLAVTAAEGPCRLELPADRCASLHETAAGATAIEVEGTTLPGFLHRVGISGGDLLKLDIEGAEVDVILDSPADVLQGFDQITVEFHDFLFPELAERVRAAIRRLEGMGFATIRFSLDNTDVLFANPRALRLGPAQLLATRYWTRNLRGLRRRLRRRLRPAI